MEAEAEVQIEKREVWESIPVGDDLGTLDYVMTAQMIADYRRVVDNPHAAYPTVAARHPANLFYRNTRRSMRVPNAGHDSQFFNPADRGKTDFRLRCVVDKYIRRGRPYLVVEATAMDEDGRLIEISRLIGMAREVGIPAHADLARKWGK